MYFEICKILMLFTEYQFSTLPFVIPFTVMVGFFVSKWASIISGKLWVICLSLQAPAKSYVYSLVGPDCRVFKSNKMLNRAYLTSQITAIRINGII